LTYNVTSLVNNIILPNTEPDDIIGSNNLSELTSWVIVTSVDADCIAHAYSVGSVSSIILIEGQTLLGFPAPKKATIDVKGIAERIRAYQNIT
jgi:hypothetical protein